MNTLTKNEAYQNLFDSFVSGGGLQQDEFEDVFNREQDDEFDGGARKKKSPAEKKGKAPRKALAPKPKKSPKAKKAVKEDGEDVVKVDVFTVMKSSTGETGGTYKSRTPRSAALKAAGKLFKNKPSARSLTFVLQKITPKSNKRVYAYEATIEKFDNPDVFYKKDKKGNKIAYTKDRNGKDIPIMRRVKDKEGNTIEIPITRKVSIKKIEVDPEIRQEQKDALKAERKERRDKEKAKAKKAEKAEKKARGEDKPKKAKAPKKEKAPKKDKEVLKKVKAEKKKQDKLLKKADELLTKYSKSLKVEDKKPKKGRGKKVNNFWGGACSTSTCY